LELGNLVAFIITTILCLFWTVPVSFVASLSNLNTLREQFEFIDRALEAAPNLEPLFNLLAPQLLVILNSLLPPFLKYVTTYEGAISGALVQASLLVKLAAFMIIQTFFMRAVTGSIFQVCNISNHHHIPFLPCQAHPTASEYIVICLEVLSELIENPKSIIELLATSLPDQSTFFIQYSFVTACNAFFSEGLRILPIAVGIARNSIGPSLTARERRHIMFGFLRPLSEPKEFRHGNSLSTLVSTT
jgi:hypothetical protein